MFVHSRFLFFLWVVRSSQSFLVAKPRALKELRTSIHWLAAGNPNNFEQRLTVVETKVETLEKGIEKLGGDIEALSNKMDANCQKLSIEIKEVNNNLSMKIEKLDNKLSKKIEEVNNKFIPLYVFLTGLATATGMANAKNIIELFK